jgi:hypothetical protein
MTHHYDSDQLGLTIKNVTFSILETMIQDIKDRLDEFRANLKVRKVALTQEQIDKHSLPPNPAKTTDPRARRYIAEHGDKSWELDALPPATLNDLVTNAIEDLLDLQKYDAWIKLEDEEKEIMGKFGKEHSES